MSIEIKTATIKNTVSKKINCSVFLMSISLTTNWGIGILNNSSGEVKTVRKGTKVPILTTSVNAVKTTRNIKKKYCLRLLGVNLFHNRKIRFVKLFEFMREKIRKCIGCQQSYFLQEAWYQ